MKILKLRPNARLPRQATAASAGYDLCACLSEPLTLLPGQTASIPTGLAIDPESAGLGVFLFARSGLATRHGLALANGVGVIDADYRGEILIAVHHHGDAPYTVADGERVAQMVLLPVCFTPMIEVASLEATERGAGGFGSTGKGLLAPNVEADSTPCCEEGCHG